MSKVCVMSTNPSSDSMYWLSDLRSVLDRTERYIEHEHYRGYDPYDGLMTPLMQWYPLRKFRLIRWGFQQVVKRVPFQIRPLLGIRKGYNPVTLALVLQAYAYRAAASPDNSTYLSRMEYLVSELKRLASPGYSGFCWGYDFDWEARYASIPAFYPTIVATGFVTHALYEAYRLHGIKGSSELLVGAVPFLVNDLNRTMEGDTFCWSYSPGDKQCVPNATMKGARLCVEAASVCGDESLFDLAKRTIAYVVERQRHDGAWPYSLNDARSWVDSFHTCYILDSLAQYERLSGDHTFKPAMQRGVEYFVANFLDPDGAVRYYDKRRDPVDATACAQAIITLMEFGHAVEASKVSRWCVDNMALDDGAFAYQVRGKRVVKLRFMRWSVAWMFLALSRLEFGHDDGQ